MNSGTNALLDFLVAIIAATVDKPWWADLMKAVAATRLGVVHKWYDNGQVTFDASVIDASMVEKIDKETTKLFFRWQDRSPMARNASHTQ